MTRKRSSPMGLELYLPVLLAFIMLPLLAQAAPLQDYTEIQQYTEGCYYNYNHYNEGDRIMTNEPCLNCTCHNKMLMCYLRVCPFTKPIGHDCIVEKREDQCCPIITCPEVPVDVASHTALEPGTELSFPEKFGCSIDGKFYLEGAQVPSNPNKPCELCYCIKNRTSCLMQECTLHIDGCTPIYNKGSCCPVRYNCDHENDVLELEDHSSSTTEATTTTTKQRPTTGFIISSTASPAVTTNCIHNSDLYADGAKIPGETACENCYCMRGDIVCAVQECGMPMLSDNGKLCHPLPAAEGECCPNNYVCKDDTATTEIYEATTLPYAYGLDEEVKLTTTGPVKDLHGAIPEEDLQLQTHIDDELAATKPPSTESEKAAATTAVTGQPIITSSQDKEQATEPEPITKPNESADETTTISAEAEELTTPTSLTSEEQTESSATDTINDAKDETSSIEATEKTVTEYPLQADKKTTIKISTSAAELTETSTTAIDSEEKYLITTSASDKSENGEAFTETPEDVIIEKLSTTEFASTENVSGVTAKAVDDEYITQIPFDISETNKKENKPLESEESTTISHTTKSEQPITVAYNIIEQDSTLIDSTTVPADIPDIENVTDKELQSTEQQHELATELPVKSPEEEEILGEKTYEESTKVSINNEKQESSTSKPEQQEEEEGEATTQAGVKDVTEKEESATIKPKIETQSEEDEQQAATLFPMTLEENEKSTASVESIDEEQSVHTTLSPIEISEIARVTKKPDLAVEEYATVTATAHVDENEEEEEKEEDSESVTDKLTTKSPIYIDSVTISDEIEGSSEGSGHYDIQKLETTSSIPIKAENHITETKPIFDEELGSGDFTTDSSAESQFEISTTSASDEAVSSISQEQEKEKDYVTTLKPVIPTEDKDTSLEISDESEEDDDKLINLTTAKPTELERTTLAAKKSEQEEEILEITTVTALLDDVSASTAATTKKVSEEEEATITDQELAVSTTAPIKTEAETISADVIEVTTMGTSSHKHLSTVGPEASSDENENKLLEEVEVSSTPTISDEAEKHKLDSEGDKEPEIYEESTEAEDITTSKSIERHEQHQETPSTQSTIDMATEAEKLDDNIRPESEEEHKVEVQTDSQTPITDFISSFTTTKPTSQTDIRTEADAEQELESSTIDIAVKNDFEKESTGSTLKPFDEPNRIDEIPDLQIPAIIPGEGDCLVGQQTFQNNSLVPTSNECELTCKCVSSIVICDHVKCSVPENAEKCILDNHSTNKCCPSYICDTGTVSVESAEGANSIEEDEDEDEDEEDSQETVTHKISTEPTTEKADINLSEVTTIKPSSTSAAPSVSIPEIEIPVAMTEEPMSHIKDEEEFEAQSTKSPIKTMAGEKHDTFVEQDISTTSAPIVEDNIIPQSVPPSEISQQEEISAEKLPAEKTKEPAHSAGHDQTEERLEENTTFKQGIVQSATDSILHTPSTESEMHSTTVVPINEYQTSKTIEEKEDENESTEFQTPSVLHTDKISEESATITEAPTDKSVLHETTEEPKLILPIESHQEKESVPELEQEQTTNAADTIELSTLAVSLDSETSTRFAETRKEIEDIPHSTASAEIAENQPTEDYKQDIFDVTTITPASKDHDMENNEEDIASTTTNYLEEHISFTTKQPPAINQDNEIVSENLDRNLENTSTVASATEDYKDIVEPTTAGLAEKDFELSTSVLGISDDASNERVTSAAADFNSESTVSPLHEEQSHTKSTTPESFSSESPEPETQTKMTLVSAHTEKDKDEETQTFVSVSDDETATTYTISAEIATEKTIDFETKIISSSTPTVHTTEVSPYDIKEDKSTTMAAEIEKLYESEESTEDYNIQSSTYGSLAQQTEPAKEIESEETTEIAAGTLEKVTHSTKGEIPAIEQSKDELESSMAHTTDSLAENEEATTKSPSALDQYKPEEGTTRTTIAEETTASTILEVNKYYKSSTPVPSIEIPSTHAPAKPSPFDLSEESSGESVESEEEISNKLDEKTTHKPVIAPTSSEEEDEEKEISGEEGEEVNEIEIVTTKPQKATTELFTTTEHEVSSDKTPQEDTVSLVTKAPTSDTINTEIPLDAEKTDRYDILSSTQATFTEQEEEHVTEQQTEENKIPAVTENVQQQETEEVTIGVHSLTDKLKDKHQITSETSEIEDVTDEHPSDEKMLYVTKVPASLNEIETITISYPKGEGVEEVTKSEEIEHVTTIPEEEEKDSEEEGKGGEEEEKEEDPSTTEALFSADEIKHVTTSKYPIDSKDIYAVTTEQSIIEDESSSAFTSAPAAADKNAVTTDIIHDKESEEQEIIEFTTARLPADETSEVIALHILADDVDQQTEKLANAEIDDFVATAKPAKDAEQATATPASEKDLSVTKVPAILAAEDDVTTKIAKKSEAQTTAVPMISQDEISTDSTTELPIRRNQSAELYHEHITEIPEVTGLPYATEQSTELPSKASESEKGESPEDTTRVTEVTASGILEEVTQLPTAEESHEEAAEFPTDTEIKHLPHATESVTEISTKGIEPGKDNVHEKTTESPMNLQESFENITAEKGTDLSATELPVDQEVSSHKLSEQDIKLTTKDSNIEGVTSPTEAHTDDAVYQFTTKLPTKVITPEEESHEQTTKSALEAELTTEKVFERITELPIQSQEIDNELHTLMPEHSTQLPIDASVSSEKIENISEYTTELPIENIKTYTEVEGTLSKQPEHDTLSPSKEEDVSLEESSELPVSNEATDKLAELPTKTKESAEENIEKVTELPVPVKPVSTSAPIVNQTIETSTESKETISGVKLQPTTMGHPLFAHHTTFPSIDSRLDDTTSPSMPIASKEEEKYTTPTTTTISSTSAEPFTTSAPHYQPQPPLYGQPPQYGPTQYEDEYTDEDEGEIFGPGTCRYGGKLYVSAQQIPRDDPCDFCFCFRSDIICLQQSCPPPISGCHEEPISGFCCPRYECPVSMATVLNITTSTTTTSTTLPPHFLHHSYGNRAQRNGCLINGRSYRVGERIESTSGPCINCTCGGDGKMKCDPQACVPEPTMQQVMAVVAAGRKR